MCVCVCVRVCVCVLVEIMGCGGVWGGHALTILQEVCGVCACVLHGFLHIAQLCMGGRRVTVSVYLSVCAVHLVLYCLNTKVYSLHFGIQKYVQTVNHQL